MPAVGAHSPLCRSHCLKRKVEGTRERIPHLGFLDHGDELGVDVAERRVPRISRDLDPIVALQRHRMRQAQPSHDHQQKNAPISHLVGSAAVGGGGRGGAGPTMSRFSSFPNTCRNLDCLTARNDIAKVGHHKVDVLHRDASSSFFFIRAASPEMRVRARTQNRDQQATKDTGTHCGV